MKRAVQDLAGTRQPTQDSTPRCSLFSFASVEQNDVNTAEEDLLQLHVFRCVRAEQRGGRFRLLCGLYNFVSFVYDGLSAKSEDAMRRRWAALKRQDHQAQQLKLVLTLSNKPRADPDAGSLGAEKESQAEGKPPAAECESDNGHRHAPPASDEGKSDGVEIEIPLDTVIFATATSSLAAPPTFISLEHLEQYRAMSKQLGSAGEKWFAIHNTMKPQCPQSAITVNGLRCRIKASRRAEKPSSTSADAPQTQQTASVPHVSCVRCRKKKRRCGPGSSNPSCTKKIRPSKTLHAFFC